MPNIKRSWKTTVFGALTLALAGFTIYNNPAAATDPQTMAAVSAGLGLILAKDSDKTGTVAEAPKQ